jgi:hypothetical protein
MLAVTSIIVATRSSHDPSATWPAWSRHSGPDDSHTRVANRSRKVARKVKTRTQSQNPHGGKRPFESQKRVRHPPERREPMVCSPRKKLLTYLAVERLRCELCESGRLNPNTFWLLGE